jgi:hypothetical protein
VTLVHSLFSPREKYDRERLIGPRAALRGTEYQAAHKEKQLGSRGFRQYPAGRGAHTLPGLGIRKEGCYGMGSVGRTGWGKPRR